MDVPSLEPLDADVLVWLGAPHAVRVASELAQDPAALRQHLSQSRAAIVPPAVAIDEATL